MTANRSARREFILGLAASSPLSSKVCPKSPIQRLSMENVFMQATENGISFYQVHGLGLRNAVVNVSSGSSVECKNVFDLELARALAPKSEPNVPGIVLEEVREAKVESVRLSGSRLALVEVKGEGNRDITLALNRISKQTQEVAFATARQNKVWCGGFNPAVGNPSKPISQ